ncbi:hypothetical protein BKA82DRAFT_4154798, partial [Pisolithus tinctorius]
EDDYMPALPPDLRTARTKTGPSLPPKGPVAPYSATVSTEKSASGSRSSSKYMGLFPTVGPSETKTRAGPSCYSDYSDGDSDSEHFTSANAPNEGNSAVEEFLEREERRRKNVRRPRNLRSWRERTLDPTKLKARQFGRSSGQGRDVDSSLWTETPAERQQRLADEVSGRKRKAANAEPVEDPEDARKKKKRDEEIRRGVEEHTRRVRGAALVNSHMEREAQKKGDAGEEPAAIWDHSRDMSVGGRLMDEKQRKQMLREARALGDRFGTGKSGGFL